MTDAPAAPPPPAEEVGPSDGGTDAPATAPALPLSGADLLALSAEQAAARWASLDDAALDAEVASYRSALEATRAELAGLGVTVSLEDGQTGTIAGIEVHGVYGRARGRARTGEKRAGEQMRRARLFKRACSTPSPSPSPLSTSLPIGTGRRGRRLPPGLRRRAGPVRVAGALLGEWGC